MRSGIFREDPGGFAETKAQTIKSCNKDREAGIKEGAEEHTADYPEGRSRGVIRLVCHDTGFRSAAPYPL